MHVLSFLFALFLSQRRECRGLGGKTKCVSRESVSNFPHRRKHDQSCPRQRGPSRPSSLPFDPPTIHDSLFVLFYLSSPLLIVFDDNEFWIFVFPLFLPFWAYDHSKSTHVRHNKPRMLSSFIEPEQCRNRSVRLVKKCIFFERITFHWMHFPDVCIMSLQKTEREHFAVFGAEKVSGRWTVLKMTEIV